ncbi:MULTISPECIES: M48 family metalloprotease [Morganellaceae]|uniref:M48 family metallopeptidase n=3 Tax=Moellerella wisconsensis TaxID=158849 RepID=A0ACD3YD75_9GAMM|nr:MULTISPECIES: M48 family metallopeptidase [Morganellaceae]QCJ72259.1 hypothetical protein C9446_20895 [Providencia heimbachae]UNH29090.1 M48 family metallopeptidase [Moellerella wisconsensis]UNH32640.1 M48 family metallopeptidase [Moellerella wisconsensis]UNH40671.1 M48 family metallopeptidase [Moellerella wisconsensis]UNH44375.1 M48 family metallopeptidase [Moellerella wisconsensis]
MTPRQTIAAYVRQNRTIPPGSILWLYASGMDDLVSTDEVDGSLDAWLEKIGAPSELTVYLDTPEGDFEDEWCIDTSILSQPVPIRKATVPAKVIARRERVEAFGEKVISTAEQITQLYTDYLTNMYRRDFGYVGGSPLVRVNWAAKHSWGGHRNITISPGYLYEPDLVEIYGLHMFACHFHEYAHVCMDKEIGSFYSSNRLDHLKALVAHELAHFLQSNTHSRNFTQAATQHLPRLDYRTPHGEGWQFLYRYLKKPLNLRLN